jgi:UDP-N-acetylmuramate dehydrogenase
MLLPSLEDIPGLTVRAGVPLAEVTRFGIGGEADLLAEAAYPEAFLAAIRACRAASAPFAVIGDGSNLIVSDRGYRGVVLRYAAQSLALEGTCIVADAGARLQALVDVSIDHGLAGLETLTGIPGSVGGAVYGNAGAYGHSISERIISVEFFDGEALRCFDNRECRFEYRESIFKAHKDWMILRANLELTRGDAGALRARADEIRNMRDAKFPPTMRCAGSIFKNLLVADLPRQVAAAIPPQAIREGKVASAYFLEKVGAKGLRRNGIQVADYHANLIYNAGGGTADDLRALIAELKHRVRAKFGIELEEEVQYLGD